MHYLMFAGDKNQNANMCYSQHVDQSIPLFSSLSLFQTVQRYDDLYAECVNSFHFYRVSSRFLCV